VFYQVHQKGGTSVRAYRDDNSLFQNQRGNLNMDRGDNPNHSYPPVADLIYHARRNQTTSAKETAYFLQMNSNPQSAGFYQTELHCSI
jgi:hypothetical protein